MFLLTMMTETRWKSTANLRSVCSSG